MPRKCAAEIQIIETEIALFEEEMKRKLKDIEFLLYCIGGMLFVFIILH